MKASFPQEANEVPSTHEYSLFQLILYVLKLGSTGFGGPVALVGYMYRDLVEKRKWISESDYKEGLTLAQLAPGPLAAQLAIYLGYVHYRILGATLVGVAFVLPSFFMVLILGWLYKIYGGLAWMQAVFYGVGASVIGIVAFSSYKLTSKNIGRDKLLWALYLIAAIVTVFTETEYILVFIGSGILVWWVRTPPRFLKGPINPLLSFAPFSFASFFNSSGADSKTLTQIALFFTKAGTFVFGSGLAIVPFLYSGVVKEYQWLTEKQFVDAVAVAMITPGPVVITVGFIGYLVAGFPGACVAALATFLPCYLFTILPAPYFKKHGKKPGIKAFVDGVTAAAIGAITGAVIVLGKRSITDIPTSLLALASVFLLWKVKRVSEPILVIGAAMIGLFLKSGLFH